MSMPALAITCLSDLDQDHALDAASDVVRMLGPEAAGPEERERAKSLKRLLRDSIRLWYSKKTEREGIGEDLVGSTGFQPCHSAEHS
jgi:hypothetical protein